MSDIQKVTLHKIKNSVQDAFSYAKLYKKYDSLTLRDIDFAIKIKNGEA